MELLLLPVLVSMFWPNAEAGENCPNLFQRFTNKHTFCMPANLSCNIKNNTVTKADIGVILKEHNFYRSRVATGKETTYSFPKCTNMIQMVWDNELAILAQKHSDQCEFEHECSECRRVKNFGVGQNLYERIFSGSRFPPKPNWIAAVKSWYNELKDFDKAQLDNFQNGNGPPPTGHFTQMMWADTWRIGCGYTLYTQDDDYVELYTCNYGPGGNIIGEPLYQKGEPCSNCPINSCCDKSCEKQKIKVDYPGLCRIQGNKGPQYAIPTDLIFFCRFTGEPDCARVETSGENKWQIFDTLSGSYMGIVLEGGESSTLNFTTPFRGKKLMCFTSFFRKGPNISGQDGTNSALEIFSIPDSNYEAKADLQQNSVKFSEFKMGLNWNMETRFAIKFSVPRGKPAQYLEIKDLSVKEGKC